MHRPFAALFRLSCLLCAANQSAHAHDAAAAREAHGAGDLSQAILAMAQTDSPKPLDAVPPPAPAAPAARVPDVAAAEQKTRWAYGLRLRVGDVADVGGTSRIRPALGFRYGRWSVGTVDLDDWLGANLTQRAPTLAYGLVQTDERRISLSMRTHNISTGESLDSLASGRYTLRGRVVGSQKLNADWQAVGEVTLDLLGRGDGITSTVGLGRQLWRSSSWALGGSLGLTLANAQHWRSAYAQNLTLAGLPADTLGAGFGGFSMGLSARGRFSADPSNPWGWNASINNDTPIAQIRSQLTRRSATSLQVGVQRFHK